MGLLPAVAGAAEGTPAPTPVPRIGTYAPAKAALGSATEALRLELAGS